MASTQPPEAAAPCIAHPARPRLDSLIEQQHLVDLLVQRWCLGVDKVNWQLVRSIHAEDEIEVNYYSPALPGVPPPRKWKTDEWLEFCRQIEGFDVTQHCLTNFSFDISPDLAVVKSYLTAEHQLNSQSYLVGGQYTHTFRRTVQGWRLFKVALDPWYTRGDQALFVAAAERYTKGVAPRSKLAIL
jgi:hypothetical protein